LHVVPPFLDPHFPFLLTAGPVAVGAAVVAGLVGVVVVTIVAGLVGVAVVTIVVIAEDDVEIVVLVVVGSVVTTELTELESVGAAEEDGITDEPPQLPKSGLQPVPQ
jgi:hypothetical protein